MPNKPKPIPHIPLKFEEAVDEFLKVKPPKKGRRKKHVPKTKDDKGGS